MKNSVVDISQLSYVVDNMSQFELAQLSVLGWGQWSIGSMVNLTVKCYTQTSATLCQQTLFICTVFCSGIR